MPEESTKVGRPQVEGKNRVEAVVVSWTGNAMAPVLGPTLVIAVEDYKFTLKIMKTGPPASRCPSRGEDGGQG